MKRYLYLSLTPEALIASMLPPEEFGNYLAVGTKKRTRGQAMFFEVDPNFESEYFNLKDIEEKCIPYPDGKLKSTFYLSIYRVLENIPLKNLLNLYLVTDDGKVLTLEKSEYNQVNGDNLHLYQQLSPVTPQIASKYNPIEFMKFVTNRTQPISVPKLVFVELILDDLANNPETASAENLPYSNIDHLRDCLVSINIDKTKPTKTVIRYLQGDILYRTCKNGFFVGDQENLLYYHFPEKEELQGKYYPWWRSALVVGFG
ncbi:MAG: hypothetical protein V1773_17840 [bacterium]